MMGKQYLERLGKEQGDTCMGTGGSLFGWSFNGFPEPKTHITTLSQTIL